MSININIEAGVFNSVYLPALTSNERFQIFYGGA